MLQCGTWIRVEGVSGCDVILTQGFSRFRDGNSSEAPRYDRDEDLVEYISSCPTENDLGVRVVDRSLEILHDLFDELKVAIVTIVKRDYAEQLGAKR